MVLIWLRELNAVIELMEFRPSEIAAAVAISVTQHQQQQQESQIVELTDKAFSFLTDLVEKVKLTPLNCLLRILITGFILYTTEN